MKHGFTRIGDEMPELRKGGSAVWAVAISLAALLGLYVGAYYATVNAGFSGIPVYTDAKRYSDYDSFARAESLRMWFFYPIHWLDRRLRPRVWNPRRVSQWRADAEDRKPWDAA